MLDRRHGQWLDIKTPVAQHLVFLGRLCFSVILYSALKIIMMVITISFECVIFLFLISETTILFVSASYFIVRPVFKMSSADE